MAVGNWTPYNDLKAKLMKKVVNLHAADTIKIALFTSPSNCGNAALVGATYSALTNEVASAHGYTTAGATAASPTVAGGGATGTITFDTDNVSWVASGGTIVARFAVAYDSTTGDLIAYCLLDTTPGDITVADGITFRVNISNILSLS